jgi:hypothetical protein
MAEEHAKGTLFASLQGLSPFDLLQIKIDREVILRGAGSQSLNLVDLEAS